MIGMTPEQHLYQAMQTMDDRIDAGEEWLEEPLEHTMNALVALDVNVEHIDEIIRALTCYENRETAFNQASVRKLVVIHRPGPGFYLATREEAEILAVAGFKVAPAPRTRAPSSSDIYDHASSLRLDAERLAEADPMRRQVLQGLDQLLDMLRARFEADNRATAALNEALNIGNGTYQP